MKLGNIKETKQNSYKYKKLFRTTPKTTATRTKTTFHLSVMRTAGSTHSSLCWLDQEQLMMLLSLTCNQLKKTVCVSFSSVKCKNQ